jgi:SAM-dependent methyltransferase
MSSDYDRMAEAYGRHRKCHQGVLRELVSGGGLTKDSRVLEIGAGTANYTAALRDLVGCRCSAVEPSVEMRKLALARGLDARIESGRAEELPFEAQSFDFAFSVNVIHHVQDRQASFSEAFRVLDAGGTLCIVTESADMIRARFPHAEYFPASIEPEIARYPTLAELEQMASRAGFRAWRETSVSLEIRLTSADSYEAKAFSSLYFVPAAEFQAGLARLKADLARGPMLANGDAAFLWATK